jgi:hypothetical protein
LNTAFEITDVIRLDTTDLHGKAFDWHHYGGPLALYRLAQFARIQCSGIVRRLERSCRFRQTWSTNRET